MIVSRREFSRLGAMGLAASSLPVIGAEAQTDRRIGYAVIGLGRIADHFMRGVAQSQHSKITALVSGHRDKAERIAQQYGVPTSSIYNYEDMDRFRDNKSVDAVYVALPNSMHAEYTIRSAKAGKHVLCEKPMATTVDECQQMIAACKAANVKLMIAYRLHYDPLHLKAVQMIKDGLIGNVHTINGAFGFNGPKGEWRLTRKLGGGGSLVDLGIYVLNASRYLTGEEPNEFHGIMSTPDKDGRFEVDENVSWVMKFPSGALCAGSSSYGTQMPGYLKVFGTQGVIDFNPAFNYDGLKMRAVYGGGAGKAPTTVEEESQDRDPVEFARESDFFSQCILNNTAVGNSDGEEGLRDMRYIDAIYKSAGTYLGTS
jgi:predicted dehydrogenase